MEDDQMLKLVHNAEPIISTPPIQVMTVQEEPLDLTPFNTKVHFKGPNLYVMEVRDNSHYLKCDLTLEIEFNRDKTEPGVVLCHFPQICDEQLNAFIWEDDTLYAVAMIQFQMRILKELLSFCINHYAHKLVIYLDDEQAEDFGIYDDFIVVEDQIQHHDIGLTKMTIPCNAEIFGDWLDFMNDATVRLQQTLWQNQRKNPAIRHYLTSHPFAEGC
jgi:hypothetical protein